MQDESDRITVILDLTEYSSIDQLFEKGTFSVKEDKTIFSLFGRKPLFATIHYLFFFYKRENRKPISILKYFVKQADKQNKNKT